MSKERVRGVVESVNNQGIKIDGEWYNFSRYDRVGIPREGDQVEIEVKDKWIKSLAFSGDKKNNPGVSKDTRVTRLALLNTATSILTTHGEPVEAEAVMSTARELETYVYEAREESENEDVPF